MLNLRRNSFRNALLSFPPHEIMEGKSQNHLREVLQFIELEMKNNPNDRHLMSVMKIHRQTIKNRIED